MVPPFFGGGGVAGGGGGTAPPRLSYRHRQDAASSVWIIAHGLGFRPAGVQVTDSTGDGVEGTVSHPDLNTTHLHFDVPVAGIVDLS